MIMKKIKINDTKKLSGVQKEFNEAFPYLKVEFFKHKHGAHDGSPKRDILDMDLTLKQCRRKHNEGFIVLDGEMTVTELEKLFQDIYGLSAQVFRKSGRSWIETTVTDDWTLNRQNEEGRELSLLAK